MVRRRGGRGGGGGGGGVRGKGSDLEPDVESVDGAGWVLADGREALERARAVVLCLEEQTQPEEHLGQRGAAAVVGVRAVAGVGAVVGVKLKAKAKVRAD